MAAYLFAEADKLAAQPTASIVAGRLVLGEAA